MYLTQKSTMARKLTTKEILADNLSNSAPVGMKKVKVWLHNIRSLHNVGSVFRSSDAFGISEILISGYTPTPPRTEINKTAIGAEEFVDWQYFEKKDDVLNYLTKKDYSLIGLEQTDDSVFLPDFDAKAFPNICLLMGNEVTGIDDKLLPHVDQFISIPQFGHKHSLNVSVATGVMLYGLLEKLWVK